jgi:hypothetical protein
VTESLSFGKPCFISNRTSLPEAGGGLARSFDPDDLRDAYDKIRTVLEDRAELQRWGEEVSREFRPVPWSASVAALLTGLGEPLVAAGSPFGFGPPTPRTPPANVGRRRPGPGR